ncbi:hypothetical protein DIS24_g8775 [Lasiodiplodia hormozganensis]|uniref:BTB domain-containing protein n=1 Tax=Lasiodiplodia hormozganensis TaxID=869390 RepID=A0AA39XYL2_9PEZI|nr:hypothetical protein DIS24_g8775 [Lasiodiplodia hormozganensis]
MADEGPDTTTGSVSAGDNHAQNLSEQLQPNFISPDTIPSASPYVFTGSTADGEGQSEPKKTKKKKNKKKTKSSATTATATTPVMPTAASSNVNAAPPSLFGGPPAAASTPTASNTTTHSGATTNASTWVASPDGEGDVIFTFPNYDGPLTRKPTLLVKSSVLASASPVFRAMFGPHFSEGQNLSKHNKTNPKKIPLPEDRASSVRVICFVLHNNEDVSPLCCVGCFLGYAEVLDKYVMKETMKHKSEEWMKNMVLEARERNYLGPNDRELLGLAYVLEAPRASFHICRDMILYEQAGFTDMGDELVPASILIAMEHYRTEAMNQLPNRIRSKLISWIYRRQGKMSDDCDGKQNCGALFASAFGLGMDDILEPEDWDGSVAAFFDYWLHATRPSTVKRLRRLAKDVGICTACRSLSSLVECLGELEDDIQDAYDEIEGPCIECHRGNQGQHTCDSFEGDDY